MSDAGRARISAGMTGAGNHQYGKPAPNRKPPKPAKLCRCGCGQPATPGRNYISGHNGRVRFVPERGGMIANGYSKVPARDHPFADADGYVLEHRLVAEHTLRMNDPDSAFLVPLGNRTYLDPAAIVHHVDGVCANNEATNLRVMTRADHTALHHAQGDIHRRG